MTEDDHATSYRQFACGSEQWIEEVDTPEGTATRIVGVQSDLCKSEQEAQHAEVV